MEKIRFEVGDKVTYVTSKRKILKGVVVSLQENKTYPIVVKFDDNHLGTFTTDGKHLLYSQTRDLYHGHNIIIEITGEEIPDRGTYVGVFYSPSNYVWTTCSEKNIDRVYEKQNMSASKLLHILHLDENNDVIDIIKHKEGGSK